MIVARYDFDSQDWEALPTVVESGDSTVTAAGITEPSIFVITDQSAASVPAPSSLSWGRIKTMFR